MDISYILNELGEDRERHFGSVSTPLYQSSNFCFPNVAAMRASLEDEMDVPFYTRGHNPTVAVLQQKIAALEGAGYIKRGQNMPRVYANSILSATAQEAIEKINQSQRIEDKLKEDAELVKLWSEKNPKDSKSLESFIKGYETFKKEKK